MAVSGEGPIAGAGLYGKDDIRQAQELLKRVTADGIETLRMVFADPHGISRGKTITAEALPSVLARGLGVPSTLLLKDLSHRTVFPVWSGDAGLSSSPLGGAGDILLIPDPDSMVQVPWSPHSAWVMCQPVFTDYTPIPFASHAVLAAASGRLATRGLSFVCGLEVEFHVFRITDAGRDHASATMPPKPPKTELISDGYKYLTETVYDQAEPVLDEIRRAAQAMGLPVRSVEVEMGPGQFEVTFAPDSAEAHARNYVLFRTMVKELCARQGLHATFMCRPRVDNCASSGWHIHQSVCDVKTGKNQFEPKADGTLTETASGWIAGLLAHATESCLITTPTVNGYKRYQPYQLAPDRIQWGRDNRGAMLRVLTHPGDGASRIENRIAEPAANPYFAFATQMLAGLAGVEAGLTAPDPVEKPYDSDAPRLPANLGEAIAAFEAGNFYRDMLGEEFVTYLATLKKAEWQRYLSAVSEWEQAEYFSNF